MMRRLLFSLSLPVLVALALAGPASAIPPTTEVTVIENAVTVDTALCGFPITFIENGSFKVTTFYDAAGTPVRTILTNYNQRYTATATANGKTLATNYPLVFITSFEPFQQITLGLRTAYHVPGAGVVLLDAGRVVLDLVTGETLFEAGPHQFIEGDADAFCAFFVDP